MRSLLCALLWCVCLGPLWASQAVSPELDAVLRQAQSQTPDAALATLEAWTGEPHPLHDLSRANALAALGRITDAQNAYTACRSRDAALVQAALGQAWCALRLNQADAADEPLTAASATLGERDEQVLRLRLHQRHAQSRWGDVCSLCRQLLALRPTEAGLWLALAEAETAEGHQAQARAARRAAALCAGVNDTPTTH